MLPKEVRLAKFQTYFLKQDRPFRYYIDYLDMTKELKIPLNDDNVIFPKDLTKAHNDRVNTINLIRQEEYKRHQEKYQRELKKQQLKKARKQRKNEKAYQKRIKQVMKFEQEIDEFVFLVPKDLQEIINEGCSLHHCVGSSRYLEEHSKGKTNIIFIRKKEDVETPFFTLEYQNNQVEQVQGKYDREEVPDNVQQAIDKWQQVIQKVS